MVGYSSALVGGVPMKISFVRERKKEREKCERERKREGGGKRDRNRGSCSSHHALLLLPSSIDHEQELGGK